MFPIPNCRSIGIHVLLAIAFGIAASHLPRKSFPANETCVNAGGEMICYFKASEENMTWDKARQLCNSFNSTLPVIRNKNDQDAVAGYLKSHLNNNTAAWTAGIDFTHNDWTWVNGDKSKASVQDSEAAIGNNDNAAMDADLNFTALAACEEFPYICQYDGTDCKSVNGAKVTDKCLRFIKDKETWYEARNHCLMSNGDLAIIGDAMHEALKTFALNQRFWIGLRKKSWRWNQNDNAANDDEIKYTNWEKTAFSTSAECISIIASDGKWKSGACALESKNAVVCQRVVSEERASVDSKSSIPPSLLLAAIGAAILIIICIIVIIVFVLRTKKGRSGQSKLNDGYVQNNREVLNTGITNAPVLYTSINEPSDVPANGSDDIRGVYADIALLTPEQSDDGGINQQPGIFYASLDFNKDPTNLEPNQTLAHSTSSPTKVGPLGDIYAIPDAKGHAVTSPGDKSASHPVKVTPQGDVYAIPMKISTSPTANPPIGAVYANLPTATLDKEQIAVDYDETK